MQLEETLSVRQYRGLRAPLSYFHAAFAVMKLAHILDKGAIIYSCLCALPPQVT